MDNILSNDTVLAVVTILTMNFLKSHSLGSAGAVLSTVSSLKPTVVWKKLTLIKKAHIYNSITNYKSVVKRLGYFTRSIRRWDVLKNVMLHLFREWRVIDSHLSHSTHLYSSFPIRKEGRNELRWVILLKLIYFMFLL